MESPSYPLSRSPSSSSFAPGSHRRSHPNLQQQHLSLAPLTPKYPIDPADYSAYYMPDTSDLHTSASISHISNLPSPSGILTNSPARSRATSRTRLKRKAKSNVAIVLPDPSSNTNNDIQGPMIAPSGALTSQGFGFSSSHILKPTQPRSSPSSRLHLHTDADSSSSWLVQTGLALTESSRENKGQSWLSKRDSSVSLSSSLHIAPNEERPAPRSGRTTPSSRSRAGSKSRGRSRRELAMTPAATQTHSQTQSQSPQISHSQSRYQFQEVEDIVPDWADTATRAEAEAEAEVAASLSSDLANEDELDDGDPYGVLDFDDHFEPFDSEDEAEMKRELAKSRLGLGRWFEGVVDVFLNLEEEFPDLETGEVEGATPRELEDQRDAGEGMQEKREAVVEPLAEGDVEIPPEQSQGVWDDVKWFGRLVARTVRA